MASACRPTKTVHPTWPEATALPSWVARPRRPDADNEETDRDADKTDKKGKRKHWSEHPVSVVGGRAGSGRG